MILNRNFLAALFAALFLTSQGQTREPATTRSAPASFTVALADVQYLLALKPEQKASLPANKYLDRAATVKNVKNGDMQFARFKLEYFKNAYLTIQVNGEYSTQVFIMSTDDSVFYKGLFADDELRMEKCAKDDIVVE